MNARSTRGFATKMIAVGLIATLPMMLQPVAAQELTPMQGSVFAGKAGHPLVGARVHLVQSGTERVFTSSLTDVEGRFEMEGLPAAAYEVAIEIDGGVYLVEQPVVVTAGSGAKLNLLVPQLADAANAKPRVVAGAAGFMSNPLAASLMVVGSALSIGALIDASSSDDDASPF